MRETRNEPILTDTYQSAADFTPTAHSIYIYGLGIEDRALHVEKLKIASPNLKYFQIEKETQSDFSIAGFEKNFFLRSSTSLAAIWSGIDSGTRVYIDMTGLTHPVWAGLLRSAIIANMEVLFVYVEPDKYVRSNAPVDGQIYDLNTRISGIAPIAGFAVLASTKSENFIFVPLLGFEGTRLRFLIEQVQPNSHQVFPVIGSPGFKPWYVFETYLGNRAALTEGSTWQSIRYAAGNCPFSCYYLLGELGGSDQSCLMKIAMIGTKPHALGAVLFSMISGHLTELIYDHPIRRPGRTDGTERLLVYHISAFISEGAIKSPEKTINAPRRRLRNI